MKNKKMAQKYDPEGANTALGQTKCMVSSGSKIEKEMSEKENLLVSSTNQNMNPVENKTEKNKSERPFRSRLPKLKMFIPRRQKSSSRNRGEDTKSKSKTTHKQNHSPRPSPRVNRKKSVETKTKQSPKLMHKKVENSDLTKHHIKNIPRNSPKLSTRSPIKRGACASPVIGRKKFQNLKNPGATQPKTNQAEVIIEAALSPSPAISPLITQKQQKDRENEQEKLRIINDILIANLPGASSNGAKSNTMSKSNTFVRPSKIPIYQNSQVPNRYSDEVRT